MEHVSTLDQPLQGEKSSGDLEISAYDLELSYSIYIAIASVVPTLTGGSANSLSRLSVSL